MSAKIDRRQAVSPLPANRNKGIVMIRQDGATCARLTREQLLQRFGEQLIPTTSGKLGIWRTFNLDRSVAAEYDARADESGEFAWASDDEYESLRLKAARLLVAMRADHLAESMGGNRFGFADQIAREGDQVTYQVSAAFGLTGPDGLLPWLGPVTEEQTPMFHTDREPSFARVLRAEVTIDLKETPDAVVALELPHERQLVTFGPDPRQPNRVNNEVAHQLHVKMTRGEDLVPVPFVAAANLHWAVEPVPAFTDPGSAQFEVLATADDITQAQRLAVDNLELIHAHRAGSDAYQRALTVVGSSTREVVSVEELGDLVATRLGIAIRPASRPHTRASWGDKREEFDDLAFLRHYAEELRSAELPRAQLASELAGVRREAADNIHLRKSAGWALATNLIERLIADFGSIDTVGFVSWDDSPYRYDINFSIAVEDFTGHRLRIDGEQMCAKFEIRGLVVDVSTLTADQICAAALEGSAMFPNGWSDHQAHQQPLFDNACAGRLKGLFASVEAVHANGFHAGRARALRQLRVIADPNSVHI
ncbi:hypothetical protein [Nocardia sp. NPDC052566]|uniref:hypothetical protein n=1 Tax=Nocardia sp. NPDC052566 TaxID=3364330 RepID=UPI0037C61F2E